MSHMTRKLVAIDVDSTIADLWSVILAQHNASQATNYTVDDVVDWNLECINMTNEQWMDAYVKAWKDMSSVIPLLIDVRLLRQAERHYGITFLTSRKDNGSLESTSQPLMEWLERHGIGDIEVVLSMPHRHKSELDYDFFVDDSPVLAEAMCSEDYGGKKLFLVDTPYNRKIEDCANVTRVRDVNEALYRLIRFASNASVPKHE